MANLKKKEGEEGVGEVFQEETKYTPERLSGHFLDWRNQPDPFKSYDNPLARVSLPQSTFAGGEDLWKLLSRRRSRRDYRRGDAISLENLSLLLWATQGITARYGDTLFRTAPSAGGLFPVETYLNVRAVEGLDQGIYHFRPHKFDLELLRKGDFAREFAQTALDQEVVYDAQATFIWSALVARSKWKYRQRAYRYIYVDAGHIAQNLYLAGEALGLGVCAIGAFYDDQANGIIGLDGIEETVIYMGTVGVRG
jgi:SagB-type dehydrogenase family enzyme